MFGKSQIYEVHACREGRWTIDTTVETQDHAEAEARKILNKPGISGVKVIQETTRGGTSRESVVFEQSRELKNSGKIFVGDIDDAPMCEEVDELYAIQGRQTINRLFRAYLDKNGVTATEVMHDFRELRRAMDADGLMTAGIGKVSTLQAKGREDVDATERRNTLYGFLDEITVRARDASGKKLPTIKQEGFDAAIGKIATNSPADQCDFLLRVAVARELIQQRSYFGKLTQTIEWMEPSEDEGAQRLLDGFIADILANATTLQDLLGTHDNLGSALGALVDLAQGNMEGEVNGLDEDSPEAVAIRLNALMGRDAMSDSQTMLVDRVRRQLEGKSPLSRGTDPDAEKEAFKDLIDKLMASDTLFGGSTMAEALTHRQSRIINKGGLAGLKEATGRVLPSLNDPVRKAAYLISLSESKMAEDIGEEISMQLEGLFVRPDSVKQIIKDNRPPNKKMQTITSVYHKVYGSSLEDRFKGKITDRLDELLASYIVDDRILDRVDDPSRPLHVRAFMLLSMCTPEMLPEGKASQLARQIVVKHLRRPNFESELVADVPTAEREKVLRDFHVQLHRCGFMQ